MIKDKEIDRESSATHADIEKNIALCNFYFSGYTGNGACEYISILVGDPSYKHKAYPPTHAIPVKCHFISDFIFTLFILMEQDAYQPQNDFYLKLGGSVFFHFDLSDQYAARASYGIAKSQIKRCRDLNMQSLHLIGFTSKIGVLPTAQEWFQKFHDEENLETSTLICDTSPNSIENLKQYMRQLILQACYNFEMEYKSPQELDLEDRDDNIDDNPRCQLL